VRLSISLLGTELLAIEWGEPVLELVQPEADHMGGSFDVPFGFTSPPAIAPRPAWSPTEED
jgi:hypothetical protein